MPHLASAATRLGPNAGWSKVAPELRDWAAENREVLERFRAACDQADGIVHSRFDQFGMFSYLNLGEFASLALLEASRLEERGDMAGAWVWYRTVFRMKVHVMRRASVFQRFIASGNCSALRPQMAGWASDRRTTAPLLRQALADVLSGEPKPEWDAFSLKVDYLAKMNELDEEWGWVQQGDDEDRRVRIGGEELPPNLAWVVYSSKRYFSNEPERSRRVLRLAFANWLAHARKLTRDICGQPLGLLSILRIGRRLCISMTSARMRRPMRGDWRRRASRPGTSALGTRNCCSTSGPGRRFGRPSDGNTARWWCCWPASFISVTTEKLLLRTRRSWVRISIISRATGPKRLTTDRCRRFGMTSRPRPRAQAEMPRAVSRREDARIGTS